MIIEILNHQQKAKDRLPSFMAEGTNMALFVDAITSETQNLETALIQLLDERHLSVALGVQLDGLGQILNLARDDGENDTDYRVRLTQRVDELARSGDIQELITAFIEKSGLVAPATIELVEVFPATIQLLWDTDLPDDPVADAILNTEMQALRAAGVRLVIIKNTLSNNFNFADESEGTGGNGPIVPLEGFGDEVLTDGGKLGRIS